MENNNFNVDEMRNIVWEYLKERVNGDGEREFSDDEIERCMVNCQSIEELRDVVANPHLVRKRARGRDLSKLISNIHMHK